MYRKGHLPGHTKSAFSACRILTIQNIISLNSFLFMFKVEHFPCLLPLSIRKTISKHSPKPESTHITCDNWLKIYNNYHYSKSLFYKGPLLFSQSTINKNLSPICFHSIKAYKRDIKTALLQIQSSGLVDEWQSDNFILYNISGLRKSCTPRKKVKYS